MTSICEFRFCRFLISLLVLSIVFSTFLFPISGFAKGEVTLESLLKEIDALNKRGKEEKRADLLYRLSEKYFEKGAYKKAASSLLEALAIEDAFYTGKALPKDGKFIPRVHTRVALANVYIKLNHLEKAIDLYNQSIAILESLTMPTEAAKLSCQTANIEIKLGLLDRADTNFQKALKLASNVDNREISVSALIGLATIERIKKNYNGAIECLTRAKQLGDLELDGIAYGRLLNELGRTYSDMEIYDKGLEQLKAAAKEFESSGELVLQANVLTSIGQIYLLERKPESARPYLEQSCQILKSENRGDSLARLLVPYGSCLADLGETRFAIAHHKSAQKLAKRASDSNTYVQAVLEEGYDNFLEGNMEQALKCYLKAEQFVERFKGKVNGELKASIYRDCGMGYRALGQIPVAIKYYSNAQECFKAEGQYTDQAIMFDSIAVAYLDEGDQENFRAFHDKAADVFKTLGSGGKHKNGSDGHELSRKAIRARASLSYNYGQYCLYQGKYVDAITVFESSLKDYLKAEDSLGHCHALRGLGLSYLSLGQNGKSKDCYEEANVIASKIGNVESQWDCATGLGKVYLKLGETKKAELELKKAISLAEKERRQFSRDSFKTSQLSLREDCFLELLELLFREGRFEEALVVSESGRARAFLDMLEGRGLNGLKTDQANIVSSRLIDNFQSPLNQKSNPSSSNSLNLIAMAGSGATISSDRSIRIRLKSGGLVSPSAVSSINASAPDLKELKDLISRSGSYFLEYVTTRDHVLLWLFDSSGNLVCAKSIDLDLNSLKELIKSAYLSIITTPDGLEQLHKMTELRERSLKRLYSILIDPVKDKLPSDPDQVVTVVPYGPLYLVPFAALQSQNNKFLLEEHALSYLPSIGVLRATNKLSSQTSALGDSLLAFGNPITKKNKFVGALPYSEKEVGKVASMFKEGSTKVEIGEAATKSKFRNLAPNYTYIHLATHGLIDSQNPMESSVVLAPEGDDDGLLTVKDILELPSLKAKLVVLSACQTGKGKVTGDGVIGLSRAFIIAGTPSILVSQWNVDDVMTEYQMALLYKELLSGKKKALALRSAQLKTISFMEKGLSSSFDDKPDTAEAVKDRANPRYWAAFQLIGQLD